MASLPLGRLLIDPARAQELINPKFVADGEFFTFTNERCKLLGEYGPLPAAIADDPAVFGCFFGVGEQAGTALVAIRYADGVSSFHRLVLPSGEPTAPAASDRDDA